MRDDPAHTSHESAERGAAKFALVAGAGSFPVEVARTLGSEQGPLVAIGLEGITDPALESTVAAFRWLRLGQMNALSSALRELGARHLLLLGKISKTLLVSGSVEFSPDDEARRLLSTQRDRSDEGLLSLIASWLERQGFEIADQSLALASMLAPLGPITKREPDAQALADLAAGVPVIRALGASGVGQCVVLKQGSVLAVEAIEGTDETIRRAGRQGGRGATVLKAARPGQDRRFDLPTIGPDTIRVMTQAGAAALAIEAGAALIVDREHCLAMADEAGIAIWGFDLTRESS